MSGDHAAVVLAAGSSRRLGQPKQLLRREGETLLHRAARLAAGTCPAVLTVVLPAQCEAWHALLHDIDHRVLFNAAAGTGMASSVRTAAPHVHRHARVLIVGCDQPALEADHLRALLEGAAAAVSGCAATQVEGCPSIPAVVPGQWFADVAHEGAATAAPAGHDQGFRQRLRALPADELFLLHAPALSRDIDTPQDLHAAQAAGLVEG